MFDRSHCLHLCLTVVVVECVKCVFVLTASMFSDNPFFACSSAKQIVLASFKNSFSSLSEVTSFFCPDFIFFALFHRSLYCSLCLSLSLLLFLKTNRFTSFFFFKICTIVFLKTKHLKTLLLHHFFITLTLTKKSQKGSNFHFYHSRCEVTFQQKILLVSAFSWSFPALPNDDGLFAALPNCFGVS